jgi:hypothetical protein
MTVYQLCERIARRSRTGDFTKLALAEQMDVLQAANAALQRAYNALPAYFKEQTQGFTLPAPVTLNNVTVINGSTAMSTGIFSAAQIGQTIQIAGDTQYNQILGTSTLRNPYMGPSGVAATATIYGDAFYSTSYPFDRVIGNPRFTNMGVIPLTPIEMSKGGDEWSYLYQNTIGQPLSWWVQQLGNSQGAQPLLVMKFAPFPDQAYSVKVRLGLWPVRYLITDVQGATTLNVPDQFLEKALIPMAIQEFMTSEQWKSIDAANDDRCERRGDEGEQFLRLQIADPAAPANKIFTPLGY